MGNDKNLLNIKHLIAYYGSKGEMAQALDITPSKLSGMLKNRRKLLWYLPEIKQDTKLSCDEILQMIMSDEQWAESAFGLS